MLSIPLFSAVVLLSHVHPRSTEAVELWQHVSPDHGDRLGSAVAFVGDVDGDGTPDVAVGAPGAASLGFATGSVHVLSGRDGELLYRLDGDSAFDAFGSSIAGLGDLDGDGAGDFAVGAPGGTPAGGAVLGYSGASGALLWTRAGDAPGDRFGSALAALPDATGDGLLDLLCGAPNADGAGASSGQATLLSGLDGRALWSVDGAAFDLVGTAVAAGAPGRALIGIPFADASGFNAGSVRVVAASDGTAIDAAFGSVAGDQLGQWLADAGDVDRDGIPDFVVGIPGADANGFDSGALEVRSGADARVLLALPGSTAGSFSGPVAGAGDQDGDGRADLAFGEPSVGRNGDQRGLVRIVSGGDGAALATASGSAANAWFGASLAGGVDVDGDGRPELLVGAPGHDDYPDTVGSVVLLTVPKGADAR